jgi:hypothetical protein
VALTIDVSYIDLSKATVPQLEQLSKACDPATFGVDQKDVLDESYRKAGKLDTAHFAQKFSLGRSGLINAINSDLLEGHDENKMIEAELYKLNVYGKSHHTPWSATRPHSVLSRQGLFF